MSEAGVIARQHLLGLRRRQTFLLMMFVLLLMTALSGFIGWSSHSTIIRVYDETVRTVEAAGRTAPPNPFATKPRLALLNNMTIYVPLIGALMAIVIGHIAIMDDRQAGVTRVIFSRPVRRSSYFWGKFAGSAVAIGAIMAACLVLSAASVALINSDVPSAAELLRLALFYLLSSLYLLLFVLIGAVSALLTRSQSIALFAAVAVWVLVTFATPEFTSGLRPVASLNPVTDPAKASKSTFFRTTSKAKPISVNEQYKALSTRILTEGSSLEAAKTEGELAPIVGFGLLLGGWAAVLVRRRDFSEEAAND